MTLTLTRLARAVQTVLTTEADQAAAEAGLVRRRRRRTGAAFVQALVLTWPHDPDASLDDLARAATDAGAPVSPQALDQRCTPQAADGLRRALARALTRAPAARPEALPLLGRFTAVYLPDRPLIPLPAAASDRWPGCGGDAGPAALKVQACREVAGGGRQLELRPGRHADARAALAVAPLPRGALRLADLGYFDPKALRAYDRQGVYWISRIQATTSVSDRHGPPGAAWEYLARPTGDRLDEPVTVGQRQRLGCRLLALRCPESVARRRRQRARAQAAKHGQAVRPERLAFCDWTVFVTNVPAALLEAAEVGVVYRVRWQMERLFKLWKSASGLGRSRSHQPERVLCEVYAKLLAVVLQHGMLLAGGGWWLGRSLWRSARVVRHGVPALTGALGRLGVLVRLLEALPRRLGRVGRIGRRRQRPATYQTLLDPQRHGLS
jgi:hypothetical protein